MTVRNFVDGQETPASIGHTLDLVDPSTGETGGTSVLLDSPMSTWR